MKRLIMLLIILAFAVWAGINIARDPGYMLLAYKHWTLETPLWFGIILWLLFAFAIIVIANIWRSVGSIAAHWHAWRSRRKLTRSNNLTVRSLLECIEGYFDSAAKNVLKSLANAEIPLINYLLAAYCAHKLGKTELRDNSLLQAKNLTPDAEIAIQLLKIEWLITDGNLTQARAELELLLQEDPHQNRGLMLAQNLYLQLGAWNELIKITQMLRKRKLITQETYEALQSKAYAAKLRQASDSKDINTLNTCWLTIPDAYQNFPGMVLVYARSLIELNHGIKAEETLRNCLKKFWDDELVYYYGAAITPDPENQLQQAEKWLSDHSNDAVLLLTLGKLSIRANLATKAHSYLESSLAISVKPETYLVLAKLCQNHMDLEKAADYYAKGLELALN